jgi:CRP/FNR family transcriptional regulator, cyclic AMP receptor protein
MPVPIDSLRKSVLFSGFTDTGLAIIAQIAKTRDVPQGMSLFLKGSAGDSLFIVDAGEIELFVGQGAKIRVLTTLAPGEPLGELALLRAGKRAVSARARVAARLIEIKRADFNETLKTRPQACMKLMLNVFGAIEKRLEALEGDILHLLQ